MKRTFVIMASAALTLAACNNRPTTPKLDSHTDTLSWAIGENIGQSLLQGGAIGFDNEILTAAILHTLEDKPQPINDTVYFMALQEIANTAQRKAQQQIQNIDQQQAQYFEQLETDNPNVKKHPSGFYYEVLKQGKGPNAHFAQRISFDYRSYLMLTGEAFDQTYGKRGSIMHVVGSPMFPGLIDAMQLMNAGSIYRFYFPYQLAIGAKGTETIPPYTPMIYEIELHQTYDN